MDSVQENLIYHFVEYYKSLGIPLKNWKIILHGDKSQELLTGINYEIVHDWCSDLKTKAVNEFISTIKNGWLVYADLDEHFDYGQSIESAIKMCQETGTEIISGEFVERTTEDFELKPVLKEESLLTTFPKDSTKDAAKAIPLGQSNTKLMLVRITEDKRPLYRNTHTLRNIDEFKVFDKKLPVNHFRWTLYTKDTIRRKLTKYISISDVYGNGAMYMWLLPRIKTRNGKCYINFYERYYSENR
jgi:hypothetical protein